MGMKAPFGSTSRPGTMLVSIVLAFIFVFVVVGVLVAADSSGSGQDVAQAEATATVPLTNTVPAGSDAVMQEYIEAHLISTEGLRVADLSGSSKSVDQTEATAGSTLQYTVVISNTGSDSAVGVVLTDSLPSGLTYEPGSLSVPIGGGLFGEANGVITWTGAINPDGQVVVNFGAALSDTLSPDTVITNMVQITGTGSLITRTAATQVISVTESTTSTNYLPLVFKPVPTVSSLQVSRPNSNNQWTVSWDSTAGATGYQLQESHDPDFGVVTTYDIGTEAARTVEHAPSTDNEYYYRARAGANGQYGPWSEPVSVVAGYRDDFTSSSSGWKIRRTTYIEEVRSWYENSDWFILQVEDSWDWGIASPYKVKAPSVPYVIEYRSQIAHRANLVSHGAVFGGDWPGQICPNPSTVEGWYEHDLCFNHFYNTNTIYYGPLKLLFERVDRLEWCPNCNGSPMKRDAHREEVHVIPNVEADEWNTWRIEVRHSGIKVFANGDHFYTYDDTRWINEPYFGVFASTDEYSNSTTRFDYYQVMPLDN